MTITDLVAPEAILPALKVISKKQALQELAAKAAELTGQNERAVFEVTAEGLVLKEVAKGVDVRRHIIEQMEFAPVHIADKPKLMDDELFAH